MRAIDLCDILERNYKKGVFQCNMDSDTCGDSPCDLCTVEKFEKEIRTDERRKCGEELLKVINEKPYGTEKNNWWLISQIRHFCFGVPRICDKKEHGNESTIYN